VYLDYYYFFYFPLARRNGLQYAYICAPSLLLLTRTLGMHRSAAIAAAIYIYTQYKKRLPCKEKQIAIDNFTHWKCNNNDWKKRKKNSSTSVVGRYLYTCDNHDMCAVRAWIGPRHACVAYIILVQKRRHITTVTKADISNEWLGLCAAHVVKFRSFWLYSLGSWSFFFFSLNILYAHCDDGEKEHNNFTLPDVRPFITGAPANMQ